MTNTISAGKKFTVVYKSNNAFAEKEFTNLEKATAFKNSVNGMFFVYNNDETNKVELI